jgi:predicted transcriptional regulator
MVNNIEIENLEVKSFVENYVKSFIKWDILNFFHKNPNSRVTLRDLATVIGRNLENVELEIEELVEKGIIEKEKKEGLTFYVFSSDKNLRKLVDNFISYCDSGKEARLKVVYKILKKEVKKSE